MKLPPPPDDFSWFDMDAIVDLWVDNITCYCLDPSLWKPNRLRQVNRVTFDHLTKP